jgi:O-acetylserine/cysteine efflux transporter
MKPSHVLLAVLVAAIWGLNFVVVAVGLKTVPPLLMLAVRFVIAALPILVVPRPALSWPHLIAICSTMFILQFALLFMAMARGMSPGMASVILQSQAVFTPVVASIALKEQPTLRQMTGIAIAVLGMGVVGSTVAAGGITTIGVLLILGAALTWSIGNIQLRAAGPQNIVALIVWMSVIPPLPLFAASLLLEGGPAEMAHAVTHMGWTGFGAILYTVVGSTYGGYCGWTYLLKHHRATTIAPFSLLVPIFAAAVSSLVLGERFGETRLLGMALVMAGLAVIALPARRDAAPMEAS